MDLTRRSFLGASAAALATFVVGCGDDDSSDASDATTTSAGGDGGGDFPVTIEGVEGDVTIESAPARVVAVGQYRDADAALALGVVPVAQPDLSFFLQQPFSPWASPEFGGQEPTAFVTDQLPFEQIAAFEPDLILATDRSSLADEYATLAQIAPTLSYANGYNQDPWQLTTRRVGQALGRSDQAAAVVDDVEATIAAAAADNPELAGKTFTFGPVSGDGTINTITSTTDASVVFFAQLGMELSPDVVGLPQAQFPGRSVISPERLDLLDADVLVLTFNTPAARAQLEANPVFQAVPAVQRGAYVALELPVALSMAFPSALSIPYGLGELVPALRTGLGL